MKQNNKNKSKNKSFTLYQCFECFALYDPDEHDSCPICKKKVTSHRVINDELNALFEEINDQEDDE